MAERRPDTSSWRTRVFLILAVVLSGSPAPGKHTVAAAATSAIIEAQRNTVDSSWLAPLAEVNGIEAQRAPLARGTPVASDSVIPVAQNTGKRGGSSQPAASSPKGRAAPGKAAPGKGRRGESTEREGSSSEPARVTPLEPPSAPPGLTAAKALLAKDASTAVVLLHTVLSDASASRHHPETWTVLGTALEALQLPHLALACLQKGLERGRPGIPWFDAGWALAARLSGQLEDDDGLARLAPGFNPAQLPEAERGYAFYLKGRQLEEMDQPREAAVALTQVPPEHSSFLLARLVMANAFAKMRQRTLAAATLQDLATTHAARLEADPKLKTVVTLNLARAHYGAGQVDAALAIYREFPRGAPEWLEVQQEMAWAYYRQFSVSEDLKALNAALGMLHTLNSPYFEGRYLPEPALLEIQILYQLCRAVEGGRKLEAFLPRYLGWRDSLKQALATEIPTAEATLQRALEFRRWRRGQGPKPAGALPEVFQDRFVSRNDLDELERRLERLSAEKTRLETFGKAWADGAFGRLQGLLADHELETRRAAGQRLRGELEGTVRELSELVNQAQIARLNLVTAEKDLYEGAAAGTLPGMKKKKRRPWWTATGETREVWPFEGEYWVDELGYYTGNAEPQCPE